MVGGRYLDRLGTARRAAGGSPSGFIVMDWNRSGPATMQVSGGLFDTLQRRGGREAGWIHFFRRGRWLGSRTSKVTAPVSGMTRTLRRGSLARGTGNRAPAVARGQGPMKHP